MTDLIRVEGASKRFSNGVVVFENLDLEVAEGETLCILGPSGCGKTTLLRAMHGLLPLDAGRVLIDSRPVMQGGWRNTSRWSG